MSRVFSFLLVFVCCFIAIGCIRKNEPVQFDNSDPLALNAEIQWAAVTEPYAACYKSADYASEVVAHFRKGEILQVIGEETVKSGGEKEKWYAFDQGWLPASTVAIYANKMRAQTAVKQLGVK